MNTKELEINTGIEPSFIQNILTKDISTLDALYDLVDNSIDAARNSILQKGNYQKDIFGLPDSYEGYQVYISISSQSIFIEDNCFGMSEATLANNAFLIAKESHHKFGIGQYGIGLKRSLLKMGSQYHFLIDNGKESYEATFDKDTLSGFKGRIVAIEKQSQGENKIKTRFMVTQIHSEISAEISNKRWLDNALQGFRDRYSIFFTKGFKIKIDYEGESLGELNSYLPGLRQDGLVVPTLLMEDIEGVKVIIESGIHEKYHFNGEENYSLSDNRKLTNDFGIYFICNDRIIVKASDSINHGWKTKWHSEYNGFVCLVRFISEQPNKLPWNTAKNGMREDSLLFLKVIDNIQPIADQYRSEIKARYADLKEKNSSTDSADSSSDPSDKRAGESRKKQSNNASGCPDDGRNKKDAKGRKTKDKDLTKVEKLITYDLDIPKSYRKICNIYLELKNKLQVQEIPYATAAALRVLIELSCDAYIFRQKEKICFHDSGNTCTLKEGSTLREKILGVAKHINQKNSETINAKQLATLESECPKKGTGVAGLDVLHGTLHNYSHQITAQQVIVLHDNFEPLIKAIWDSQS